MCPPCLASVLLSDTSTVHRESFLFIGVTTTSKLRVPIRTYNIQLAIRASISTPLEGTESSP